MISLDKLRQQSEVQQDNTHNFRRCESIHPLHLSPPHRGGIFVETRVAPAAPQRGAIFLLYTRPISSRIQPSLNATEYSTPLGCGSLIRSLLQICHPDGVERGEKMNSSRLPKL